MIQSTAGRFDNAPAHMILTSTRFNTRELGTGYEAKHKKPKEESEAARIEKLNKAKAKEDIRKAKEALERLQKMEIMRKKELAAKRKRMQDVRPGESQKDRKNRRVREQNAARLAAEIAAMVPQGYDRVKGMELPGCLDTAYFHLCKGHVQGVKAAGAWWCNREEMVKCMLECRANKGGHKK